MLLPAFLYILAFLIEMLMVYSYEFWFMLMVYSCSSRGLGRGGPGQRSPSLSAPGTGLMEDSFLMDQGRDGAGGGGFEMIHLHYIHCALYF